MILPSEPKREDATSEWKHQRVPRWDGRRKPKAPRHLATYRFNRVVIAAGRRVQEENCVRRKTYTSPTSFGKRATA